MQSERLSAYCASKIHPLVSSDAAITKIVVVPSTDRSSGISATEKTDKRFNYKRPTIRILGDTAELHVFPGEDYLAHYTNIYQRAGYTVTTLGCDDTYTRSAVSSMLSTDFPYVDVIVLGYVEPLAPSGEWVGSDIAWKVQHIGEKTVAFVGVEFSYWGNIIYFVAEQLAAYTRSLIYIGKLGSLHAEDIPNKTLVTGNSSMLCGEEITWDNIFSDNPLLITGRHITLPSVLDETRDWCTEHQDSYRFVDPEIGWAAKACRDAGIQFSYLHLVTDNLRGEFSDDLTNERNQSVIIKRAQYVGVIRAILWHSFYGQHVSLQSAVMKAQQARVDRGLMRPLERNWEACLSFAYHTQEEAWEVVRELPRREWKDQEVIPENVLSELADTQIQLLTTLTYAGFSEVELTNAVLTKLQAKRKDWK